VIGHARIAREPYHSFVSEQVRPPRDGLLRFGLIVATLVIGLVAVVSLSSAWLALIAGAVVVALVALDVMFHGASNDLRGEDDITPHSVTIDLDKRTK
jgi:hypothetical protein